MILQQPYLVFTWLVSTITATAIPTVYTRRFARAFSFPLARAFALTANGFLEREANDKSFIYIYE